MQPLDAGGRASPPRCGPGRRRRGLGVLIGDTSRRPGGLAGRGRGARRLGQVVEGRRRRSSTAVKFCCTQEVIALAAPAATAGAAAAPTAAGEVVDLSRRDVRLELRQRRGGVAAVEAADGHDRQLGGELQARPRSASRSPPPPRCSRTRSAQRRDHLGARACEASSRPPMAPPRPPPGALPPGPPRCRRPSLPAGPQPRRASRAAEPPGVPTRAATDGGGSGRDDRAGVRRWTTVASGVRRGPGQGRDERAGHDRGDRSGGAELRDDRAAGTPLARPRTSTTTRSQGSQSDVRDSRMNAQTGRGRRGRSEGDRAHRRGRGAPRPPSPPCRRARRWRARGRRCSTRGRCRP